MAKLTANARRAIPADKFALPARRYPIEDRRHARNALARVSQYGTPAEKAKVRAAVHREYPGIGGKGDAMKKHEKKGGEKKQPKAKLEHEGHKAVGGQHGHMMGMKDHK